MESTHYDSPFWNATNGIAPTFFNQSEQITTWEVHTSEVFVLISNVLYCMIITVGLIANVSSVILVVCRKSVRKSIYLYTTNLSICGILILLFHVPTQMVFIKDQWRWKMGLGVCKLVNIILPVSLNCTIGSLLAITFDRVRTILRQIQWPVDSRREAKVALPIIWVVSITVNMPLLIYPRLESIGESVVICNEGWSDDNDGEIYWISMFVFAYCLPLFALILACVFTAYTNTKGKEFTQNQAEVSNIRHQRLSRICFLLVITFTMCTGLQHISFFVGAFADNIPLETLMSLSGVSSLLISLQAAINPFIYDTNISRCITKCCRFYSRLTSRILSLQTFHTNADAGEYKLSSLSQHQSYSSANHPWRVLEDGHHLLDNRKCRVSLLGNSDEDVLDYRCSSPSPLSLGSHYVLNNDKRVSSLFLSHTPYCCSGRTIYPPVFSNSDNAINSKKRSSAVLHYPHEYKMEIEALFPVKDDNFLLSHGRLTSTLFAPSCLEESKKPTSSFRGNACSLTSKWNQTLLLFEISKYPLQRKCSTPSPLVKGSSYLLNTKGFSLASISDSGASVSERK